MCKLSLSFRNHIYWTIIKLYDNVCGYNILPKFVNQLIASSIQIIQIDSRHLLSYYKPISLVYYYMGVFCDIWTLLLKTDTYVAGIIENAIINVFLFCTNSVSRH